MKHQLTFLTLGLSLLFGPALAARALDNKFTYEGRLTDNSSPATAEYQIQFRLRDGPSDASAVLATAPPQAVSVVDGLFSAPVDFPVVLFDGNDRWLEVSIAPPAAPTTFTVLLPRQKIMPTPYALYAAKAGGLASGVPLTFSDKVTFGPVTGPPFSVLSPFKVDNLNGDLLDGLDSTDFWQLTGNTIGAGKFLGTLNDVALDLRVHDVRALRLEPTTGTPNLIGGAEVNVVAGGTIGAVIAGGGRPGEPHAISGEYNAVGGGLGNGNDAARYSFLGGGHRNGIRAGAVNVFLGGGADNSIGQIQTGVLDGVDGATLAGGEGNAVKSGGDYGTISGGRHNSIDIGNAYITIAGGLDNHAGSWNGGRGATVSGGLTNQTTGDGSVIGGGEDNTIQDWAHHATIAGGRANRVRTNAMFAAIGGGVGNQIGTPQFNLLPFAVTTTSATVAGGEDNVIHIGADHGTIGGGRSNTIAIAAIAATIAGGSTNSILTGSSFASIGGGAANSIQRTADSSTIGGGEGQTIEASSRWSVIAGGQANTIQTQSDHATIGGGTQNVISNTDYATIPGGSRAKADKFGQLAYAGGCFEQPGDAQTAVYVARGRTTFDNSVTRAELFLDGSGKRMTIPPGGSWTFDILVVARSTNGLSAGYQFRGVAENNQGTISVFVLGGSTLHEDVDNWNVVVQGESGALVIKVQGTADACDLSQHTGILNVPIQWVASIRTVETFGPDGLFYECLPR